MSVMGQQLTSAQDSQSPLAGSVGMMGIVMLMSTTNG
jgi:hypothetical protein